MPGHADEGVVYRPLDTMLTAYQAYSRGVRDCAPTDLAEATRLYQHCLAQLESDPTGLGQRYEAFLPKARYMIAWSFFRRAEITNDERLWDSSLTWFRLLPLETDNGLGHNAAYMAADLEYRAITRDRYETLCGAGRVLATADADNLRSRYRQCQASFGRVKEELSPASPLHAAVELKLTDLAFDLATIEFATRIELDISDDLSTIDYSAIAVEELADAEHRTTLQHLLAYGQTEVLLRRLLISQDGTIVDDIDRLGSRWTKDRLLKEASLAQGLDRLPEAARTFEEAAEDDFEASYWQGMAFLIVSTSSNDLDELRANTRQSLQFSLTSFETFIRKLSSRRNSRDYRLACLGARAEHLVRLLKIALGQQTGEAQGTPLGRDDIRFLIRVAAATGGNTGQRCLSFLLQHLEKVLTKVAPGPRTAPLAITGSFLGCTSELTLPLTHQEVLFYKGMVHALQAETALDELVADRAFAQTAEAMDRVAEPYRGEAQYVRARALVRAGRSDEAQDPLRWLIENQHSLRAAYWYGASLRSTRPLNDTVSQNINEIMQHVVQLIEQSEEPLEYRSFLLNARAMKERHPKIDSIAANLLVEGFDRLNCPESLSVDNSGLWPELVFYETLAEEELIRREFALRGRRELLIYGPPHKPLYPTSQSCDADSARYLANRLAPILDAVYVDDRWQARLAFVDGRGRSVGPLDSLIVRDTRADTIVATTWNSERSCLATGPGIPVSSQLEVTAFHRGFHPTVFDITSYEPGVADYTIGLAAVTTFVVDTVQDCSAAKDCLIDNQGRNQVISPTDGGSVFEAFSSAPALRDFALDVRHDRYLAVSCEASQTLLSFPKSGSSERLTLNLTLTDSLVSPEGIAVDRDGNIYIVDWGGHEVVVLDGNGVERFRFGRSGSGPDLTFPCRIAIEEDVAGIVLANGSIFRERHLLVTDRVGIHRFDSKGRYLDQPLTATDLSYPIGALSGVAIHGYGEDCRLSVIDRVNGRVSRLRAVRATR
jgi:hypothetical protein